MPAPTKKPTVHPGRLITLILGFALLLALGGFAFIALNPKAREWATSESGPTRFKVVNRILAFPTRVIGQSKGAGAVADRAGNQPDPVAALIAMAKKPASSPPDPVEDSTEADTPPTTNPSPVAPALSREPETPVQVQLAGGIIISNASPAGAPVVRAAFFYWVVNLNITGVFQSPPYRIMLNNRLVYEGDEINRALGVTFDHLDPANKLIVFRDQIGATVTRSY